MFAPLFNFLLNTWLGWAIGCGISLGIHASYTDGEVDGLDVIFAIFFWPLYLFGLLPAVLAYLVVFFIVTSFSSLIGRKE